MMAENGNSLRPVEYIVVLILVGAAGVAISNLYGRDDRRDEKLEDLSGKMIRMEEQYGTVIDRLAEFRIEQRALDERLVVVESEGNSLSSILREQLDAINRKLSNIETVIVGAGKSGKGQLDYEFVRE